MKRGRDVVILNLADREPSFRDKREVKDLRSD
jgi:hypothetical protein